MLESTADARVSKAVVVGISALWACLLGVYTWCAYLVCLLGAPTRCVALAVGGEALRRQSSTNTGVYSRVVSCQVKQSRQ